MRLKVDVKGLKPMQKKMLKAMDPADIHKVVAKNTAQLMTRAMDKAPVSTEKTNPGGSHGQLKRSIMQKVEGDTGIVRATVNYAQYVELGTRFMAPQPYMSPALKEQEPMFLRDLKKLIARKFK